MNAVQSGTARAGAWPYSQDMQTDYVKAAVIAAWICAIGTVGLGFGVTSFAGWAALAVLSLVPPAVTLRLSGTPSPSMSETIRDVLR
jgi:hypothetical protein